MSNGAILKNWSVRGRTLNPYAAPETLRYVLCGEVYGHPDFKDGEFVTTSSIRENIMNYVSTQNTVYELGEPDVSYILWCEENGITIDSKEPVKVTKGRM